MINNEDYAKLEALAVKAGLIDTDGLKLVDLTKVELGEDGTLKRADNVIRNLKKSKPYLFGPIDARTLSPEEYKKEKAAVLAVDKDRKAPVKGVVDVRDMSPEEYAAAKAEILDKK